MRLGEFDNEFSIDIDTQFIELVGDEEVLEITEALEKLDNHYLLTDKTDWEDKSVIIKDLSLNNSDTFNLLLKHTNKDYDIRKFLLKASNKYNFYCYLEILEDKKEKIQALIVCNKQNKIKGIIMIR